MSQTKKASAVEAVVNTLIGLALAFTAQSAIAWVYNIQLTARDNFTIVFWMTGISTFRSYVVRRLWNSEFWKRHKKQQAVIQTLRERCCDQYIGAGWVTGRHYPAYCPVHSPK